MHGHLPRASILSFYLLQGNSQFSGKFSGLRPQSTFCLYNLLLIAHERRFIPHTRVCGRPISPAQRSQCALGLQRESILSPFSRLHTMPTCHILCIQPSPDGLLNCYCLLDIVNNAPTSIGVCSLFEPSLLFNGTWQFHVVLRNNLFPAASAPCYIFHGC